MVHTRFLRGDLKVLCYVTLKAFCIASLPALKELFLLSQPFIHVLS